MNTRVRSVCTAWSGNTLAFTITAAAGSLASLTTETIKGIPYAVFPASSGSYVAVYAP